MANERRKFKRIVVEALTFAILRPRFKKLISMVNMSVDGLACEYLVHKKMSKAFAEPKIDVLLFNANSYRPVIPCRVIYEVKMVRNGYEFSNSMERRRCGLQFNGLTDKQRKQIELFIKSHMAETLNRKLPKRVNLTASMVEA